jgi:hypothetical protein
VARFVCAAGHFTMLADGVAAARLRRALTSMSPEMVANKRLDRVRQVVVSWL